MIFFYIDLKDTAKRNTRGPLSSLLIQLSDTSDICWSILSDLYAKHRDGSDQPSEATLIQCLGDMLQSVAHTSVYIIMDALDECLNTTGTPSPREKVLNFVEDLVSSQYPNFVDTDRAMRRWRAGEKQ